MGLRLKRLWGAVRDVSEGPWIRCGREQHRAAPRGGTWIRCGREQHRAAPRGGTRTQRVIHIPAAKRHYECRSLKMAKK